MTSFHRKPARPRSSAPSPSYPRFPGLGLVVVATACGGSVAVNDQAPEQGGSGGAAGADQGGAAGSAGEAGQGGSGAEGPSGTAPYPYDAGVPPDAAEEPSEPFPTGDVAEPFDAGPDVWETLDGSEDSDAQMDGFAPGPYDAGCEASIPGQGS